MQGNTLRMAIRATASAMIVGVAGQASALELSAGDYTAELYGYARFNAVYDIDEEISLSTRSGSFEAINVGDAEGNEVSGHFSADAVQTRLGVRTTTPEGVKVVIEGDFRPGTLRLRHGYGEYKGVLLGQTWSNFGSFVGNTTTLDFDGLPGLAGFQARISQARYTTGPLSISLEEPATSFLAGTTTVDGKQSLPTFTARIEDSADGLSYSGAILAQQVEFDTGTEDDSVVGFAAFVAGQMALTDTLTVQGTVSYTDGANAYLYRSGEEFGAEDAYIDGSGDLESIAGYGGSLGVGMDLGGGRSANIGYGIVTVDWDDAEDDGLAVADKSETNQAVMANYLWTPAKNVMMGVEYAYLMRENVSGDDGDANRIMFSGQYNF
ncbi:DcaP family trimeric outer membrane transporter [Marinobacter sp. SS21]|uniref:DcaP family trimeric outer membrane transporter n=1 Tax=Marinobacter sp. SS21 TaxID=2979460 RepID=UPI00232B1292|nr:DcaP family trimeric outer membrane transporter [Marinobacter sp. SS21]MDC0662486.1 DcaP family trimeric outer membrane transporter [Marinobacter sp. SS21]